MQRSKFQAQTCIPYGSREVAGNCIAMALISLGDKTPEETLRQLKSTSLKSLQQMKAATGVQPKASRIPPLVPTFKARIKLQAMTTVLPDFQLYQKCRDDIKLDAPSNPILPEGSKLLSIQPAKTSSDEGGGDQSLPPPIVLGKTADKNEDHCEQLVQTWGSPWSPLEFVKQAVKAGHPSQLDACLPMRLKLLSQKFRVVPLLGHIPLSKRFGIKQGAKTRCVDFSRSGINGCAQVSESPKPDTVDIIASLGLSLMRHRPAGASWKVRTCDLSGAYRQCAVYILTRFSSRTCLWQCLGKTDRLLFR